MSNVSVNFKKAIPRRLFLKGAGVSMALPLLDAMVPAHATVLDTTGQPALRLAYIYVPNGILMDTWSPQTAGANFEWTPTLKAFEPFRHSMRVLANLDGGPIILGGGHERACAMWLTGMNPKKSVYDIECGVSVDQAAARVIGKQTALESLELAIENAAELVGGSGGYAAAYTTTISWRGPKTPMPAEFKPRAVFERLFGDGGSTSAADRVARLQTEKSVLDFVAQATSRIMSDLGASDRSKLDEYLTAVRDVENRVQKAEQQVTRELPQVQRPVGIPEYDDHAKLMFDLLALAFQTDTTRVASFMMAREQSELVYSSLGISEPHHPLTHNRGLKWRMEQTSVINAYHARLMAGFLARLAATNDGDGSLLDHSMIVYGSGLGDGDIHEQYNLPIALFGRGAGKLASGGRYIQYAKDTPFCNLHVTMLNMAGIPTATFGNSTGELDLNQQA